MTSLRKRLAPLAIACALAVPGAAMAQEYFCTMSTVSSSWIPPQFVIAYSGSNAVVTHGWFNEPAVSQVRIRGSNSERRLNYSLTDARTIDGIRAVMAFRLTHTVATGRLVVRMNPVAYANSFSGNGTCAPM